MVFDADMIKAKAEDMLMSLRVSREYRKSVCVTLASIVTIIVSACAIGKSAGSGSRISHLEDQAAAYKEGQIQIDNTLGDKKTIQLSKDSEDLLGKTGLMLQYKDLSELPEQNSFSDMRSALDIEKAVDNENESYAESIVNSIPDFAGDYGGLEIDVGAVSGNNIRLAAYTDRSAMTAHDDSTVQNVLYQQVDRTIKAEKYGESDIKNSLIILSGTDIRGFNRISSGAEMYTMFGESTGSKATQKYVCTGVERGTVSKTADSDVNYVAPENNSSAESSSGYSVEESYSTDNAASSSSAGTASSSSSESEQKEKPSVSSSDPEESEPSVRTDNSSDSSSYDDDAEIIIDNEAKATTARVSAPIPAAPPETQDEGLVYEDTDDSYTSDDAAGTGSTESGTPSASSVSGRNIINAENVLGSDEWPITRNQKADLILYQYDTSSQNVMISYWTVASNAN